MSIKPRNARCLMCQEPAFIVPVERLPNNGIAYRAVHEENRIEHGWAQYDRPEDSGRQDYHKNPRVINCPRCHRRGRIGSYRPELKRQDKVTYFVVHEVIKGTWGKGKNKTSKRRRCYITDPEQRNAILKKLGRFIEA